MKLLGVRWHHVTVHRTMRSPGGFTMVELLIATSLMALAGGASVAALAGGVRVWERASAFGVHRQMTLVAFSRMRRDLHNGRRFRPVPFEGSYDRYSLAAAERAAPDPELLPEMGRLGYFLDERRHVLCRSFTPYRLLKRYRLTERCETMLEDVQRVRFSYFGKREDSGAVDWSQSWKSETPPAAVKCELTVRGTRGPSTPQSTVIYVPSTPPLESTDDTPAAP